MPLLAEYPHFIHGFRGNHGQEEAEHYQATSPTKRSNDRSILGYIWLLQTRVGPGKVGRCLGRCLGPKFPGFHMSASLMSHYNKTDLIGTCFETHLMSILTHTFLFSSSSIRLIPPDGSDIGPVSFPGHWTFDIERSSNPAGSTDIPAQPHQPFSPEKSGDVVHLGTWPVRGSRLPAHLWCVSALLRTG